MAHDLAAFVVPDERVARSSGLDLEAAGIRPAATPRHATVLLVVGELPAGLAAAAGVAYAQMPRPRTILAVGTPSIPGLPEPDAATSLDQDGIAVGVAELRRKLAFGAFAPEATAFQRAAVQTRTEYACPMHPEIIRDEPGSCPICGMDLVSREAVGATAGHDHGSMAMGHEVGTPAGAATAGYTCPMHPEVVRPEPGSCPICGMALVPREPAPTAAARLVTEPRGGHAPMTHTCPMHPEVERSEPGRCPVCGMNLVPKDGPAPEATDHAGHGDHRKHDPRPEDQGEPERAGAAQPGHVGAMRPGAGHAGHDTARAMGDNGHDHQADAPMAEHAGHGPARGAMGSQGQDLTASATPRGGTLAAAPSHALAVGHDHAAIDARPDDRRAMAPGHSGQGAPTGDDNDDHLHAPHTRAGMDHAAMDGATDGPPAVDHTAMDHAGMDHGMHDMNGGFMSMVAMTKDLPRSRDGLPMEWVEAPFGPLFPGLPAGLALTLTLDGDTVARAALTPGATHRGLEATWPGPAATFPDRLARLNPLAPAAYRLLARRALESAFGSEPDGATMRGRIGAAERERVASHLSWLAGFFALLGDQWLARRAAALQLAVVRVGGTGQLARLAPKIDALVRAANTTPLLRQRLIGIGDLGDLGAARAATTRGPVARSSGSDHDARGQDPVYRDLGFMPVVEHGGDALARLRVRLRELQQSLDLLRAVGTTPATDPLLLLPPDPSGAGTATVETPRGAATLHVELERGTVTAAHLETPSSLNVSLVPRLAEGAEVADALVGVASLDLSPWEIDR